MRGAGIPDLAAMEQTHMLAHALAQNNDPKFQVHMLCLPIPYFSHSTRPWCMNSGFLRDQLLLFINVLHTSQNSKFRQFVSKMSRGELIIHDNQIKPSTLPAPGDCVTEYQQQFSSAPSWADEYVRETNNFCGTNA